MDTNLGPSCSTSAPGGGGSNNNNKEPVGHEVVDIYLCQGISPTFVDKDHAFFASHYAQLEEGDGPTYPLRFVVGGEEFKTHRFLMRHFCRRLLLTVEGVVRVPEELGVSAEAFRIFIKAIYLKQLTPASFDLWLQVRRLAEHFGCGMVLAKCDNIQITFGNCHTVFERWPEGGAVKERALEIVKSNFRQLVETDKSLAWGAGLWVTLLSLNDLPPPMPLEDDIFRAVSKWQERNMSSVDAAKFRSLFKDLFQYPLMSVGLLCSPQFRDCGILDLGDILKICGQKDGNEALNFSRARSPTLASSQPQPQSTGEGKTPSTLPVEQAADGASASPILSRVINANVTREEDEDSETGVPAEKDKINGTSLSSSAPKKKKKNEMISQTTSVVVPLIIGDHIMIGGDEVQSENNNEAVRGRSIPSRPLSNRIGTLEKLQLPLSTPGDSENREDDQERPQAMNPSPYNSASSSSRVDSLVSSAANENESKMPASIKSEPIETQLPSFRVIQKIKLSDLPDCMYPVPKTSDPNPVNTRLTSPSTTLATKSLRKNQSGCVESDGASTSTSAPKTTATTAEPPPLQLHLNPSQNTIKSVATNFVELREILGNVSARQEVEMTSGIFDGQLELANLPDGVRIFGTGSQTVIRATGCDHYIWSIRAGKDWSFEGMKFEKEGGNVKKEHKGLCITSHGVKIHALDFVGCQLDLDNCDGAQVSDVRVENSHSGLVLNDKTKNTVMKNLTLNTLTTGIRIRGSKNKISVVKCLGVQVGVIFDGVGTWKNVPCAGNFLSDLTYTFGEQPIEYAAVKIRCSKNNVVEGIKCLEYKKPAIPLKDVDGDNCASLWIPIQKEGVGACKNMVKGVSGGPIWVGGTQNFIEDVSDCPFLRAVGSGHVFTNCRVEKANVYKANNMKCTNCNFGPSPRSKKAK